ncbi:unnamed protein product [Ilex paraguariensis]|uniref:Uncharacterized protein n=1 Tax=Ilex paraguariensis TaxID=185542 RepID=A0ABC8UR54_9AQUA
MADICIEVRNFFQKAKRNILAYPPVLLLALGVASALVSSFHLMSTSFFRANMGSGFAKAYLAIALAVVLGSFLFSGRARKSEIIQHEYGWFGKALENSFMVVLTSVMSLFHEDTYHAVVAELCLGFMFLSIVHMLRPKTDFGFVSFFPSLAMTTVWQKYPFGNTGWLVFFVVIVFAWTHNWLEKWEMEAATAEDDGDHDGVVALESLPN